MKPTRTLTLALATVTLSASAIYLFIYLYRWEWNRALICGFIFLAAEIGTAGWSTHVRIKELDHKLDALDARRDRINRHLVAARRHRSHAFDWMRPDAGRTNVFIPILLGTSLVVSGLAWAVDRIGRATAGRIDDARVATRLSRLGPPPHGFLDDPGDPIALLRGPAPEGSAER
jgi:hypothetical protein